MKQLLKEKKNLWLLAWPVGIILFWTASHNRETAEHIYAGGLYRWYGQAMSRLTGGMDFSVAELLLIAVPLLAIVMIIAGIVKIVREKGLRAVNLARLVRNLLLLAGIVYAWYMIGCGTNYYRYEFASFSGLEIQKSSVSELYELYTVLVDETNRARENAIAERDKRAKTDGLAGSVTSSEDESYESYLTGSERREAARQAMYGLGEEYSVLEGFYPRPKEVFFSRFMSRFGITGVYFPWTVEANVNIDVPDYTIPATMCHELSHLRGFMREDEANYIGYLACVHSDEPELVYSGYMSALVNVGNRLYAESRDLYYEACRQMSRGVVADINADIVYWDAFEDSVTNEIGEKVNDTYLKANKQTDGTKSYGRMTDLLLAEYRARREQSER